METSRTRVRMDGGAMSEAAVRSVFPQCATASLSSSLCTTAPSYESEQAIETNHYRNGGGGEGEEECGRSGGVVSVEVCLYCLPFLDCFGMANQHTGKNAGAGLSHDNLLADMTS